MPHMVKSGNFSDPEKEVSVLSSCVIMFKSTQAKLEGGAGMFKELREVTLFLEQIGTKSLNFLK